MLECLCGCSARKLAGIVMCTSTIQKALPHARLSRCLLKKPIDFLVWIALLTYKWLSGVPRLNRTILLKNKMKRDTCDNSMIANTEGADESVHKNLIFLYVNVQMLWTLARLQQQMNSLSTTKTVTLIPCNGFYK